MIARWTGKCPQCKTQVLHVTCTWQERPVTLAYCRRCATHVLPVYSSTIDKDTLGPALAAGIAWESFTDNNQAETDCSWIEEITEVTEDDYRKIHKSLNKSLDATINYTALMAKALEFQRNVLYELQSLDVTVTVDEPLLLPPPEENKK
jgi:hypothetical protein